MVSASVAILYRTTTRPIPIMMALVFIRNDHFETPQKSHAASQASIARAVVSSKVGLEISVNGATIVFVVFLSFALGVLIGLQERLDNAATLLARGLDRALAAWEIYCPGQREASRSRWRLVP